MKCVCFFILQEKFDRFFPSADVTIPNSIYSLLEYYNNKERTDDNGIFYDLKFINLLLKGIFGYCAMAEMESPLDYQNPKMILAKGNNLK